MFGVLGGDNFKLTSAHLVLVFLFPGNEEERSWDPVCLAQGDSSDCSGRFW